MNMCEIVVGLLSSREIKLKNLDNIKFISQDISLSAIDRFFNQEVR